MSETFSNLGFEHAQSQVAGREELILLLAHASELEHRLACAYLFAAHSLKNNASEGGLTEEQAGMVRKWRRGLASKAVERMSHLAQIANLVTAIGGVPSLTRPSFPLQESAVSSDSGISLEPFSQALLDRLVAYEQPAPIYRRIAESLRSLPAEEVFIGPSEAQADPRLIHLEDHLTPVVDQASALAAISMIATADGRTASADAADDTNLFDAIRTDYGRTSEEAQQNGAIFDPVRPVGTNPRLRPPAQASGYTPLIAPLTCAVADLFNQAYDVMLLLLSWLFLHTEESEADRELLASASFRLMASVIRPLSEGLTQMPVDDAAPLGLRAGPTFGDAGNLPELPHRASAWAVFADRLWRLATAATTLSATTDLPLEILEATAALQELACTFAPAEGQHGVDAKIAELKQLQIGLEGVIKVARNGPYLAINVETLTNWLGERLPARPVMAFCRCGGSSRKPFCDGTHARIDFTGLKDPNRVPDRRDTYTGTAVTVFDNRGICAHSGFCTDRLNTVFHVGKEPFVSANGARMDDIIRAVRACPSGALSYAIDGIEARNQVDQPRPPAIEVSKDGPYRVTGGIPLKEASGEDVPRNTGVSYEHYSLCRCGHSQNKPFCSGMHWYVNFHDPQMSEDHEPSLFEWVGGLPALLRMTHLFYDKYVPQEPLLRPLFAEMAPDHPQRVAAWLAEVFGGPKTYSTQYGGYPRMLSQHIGKGITEAQRSRWASLLAQAADEAGLPADPEFRSAFGSYIEWGSRLAVENATPGAHPPQHMPMPRWDWGTAGLPGSRVSALAPVTEKEEEAVLPAAGESVHFSRHIKPLFRQMDRQSMRWAFDLWSYEDVKKHVDGILQRLRNGSMPCDGAWPQEKVETFQRWVESGMQE